MSVESVALNEITSSMTYEGGGYPAPSQSAPPAKPEDPSFKSEIRDKVFEKSDGIKEERGKGKKVLTEEESPVRKNIEKNYEKLKEHIQSLNNTELRFEREKETKRDIIKILDKKTKKVIRQIPPKEFYKFIVELYKQNEKNAEKMMKNKSLGQSRGYNEKLADEIAGLILNRNI